MRHHCTCWVASRALFYNSLVTSVLLPAQILLLIGTDNHNGVFMLRGGKRPWYMSHRSRNHKFSFKLQINAAYSEILKKSSTGAFSQPADGSYYTQVYDVEKNHSSSTCARHRHTWWCMLQEVTACCRMTIVVRVMTFPKLSCSWVYASETSMHGWLSEVFLFVVSGVVVVLLCP